MRFIPPRMSGRRIEVLVWRRGCQYAYKEDEREVSSLNGECFLGLINTGRNNGKGSLWITHSRSSDNTGFYRATEVYKNQCHILLLAEHLNQSCFSI